MPTPIKVLIVEDSAVDTELLIRHLQRESYQPIFERVDNEQAMRAALQQKQWDLVIADNKMPQFSALEALHVLRQMGADTPFIVVSGTIAEEGGIMAMKSGAADFIVKDRLSRLGLTIARCLEQKQLQEEKIRVENALRQSDKQFRMLFQKHPLPMWVYDLQTLAFLAVNEAAVRSYGYSEADFLSMTIKDIRPPEDIPLLLASVAESPRELQKSGGWRHLKKDGTAIEIEIASNDLTFAGERARLVMAIDVTERNRVERQLRLSEQRFQNLATVSPVGIFRTDARGLGVYVNARWSEITGLSLEQAKGEGWVGAVHPEDRQRVSREWNQLTQTGGLFKSEFRFCRPDGVVTWVLGHAVAEISPEGQVSGYVGTITDITEVKYAQDEIREKAQLLDLDPDAIFIRDLEDRILYWNQGAQRLYGWAFEEVAGRMITEIICKDQTAFKAAQKALFEKGWWIGELQQTTKHGAAITVFSRWTLLRDEQDKPKSVLVINTDVSEKKRLEKQFYRAQRLESIGTLASGIAHDLNNVLAPVLMGSQILRMQPLDEEFRKLISTMEASALRGSEIVKQLVTFAKGVDGKRETIPPVKLIAELENLAKQTFPKSIVIKSALAPSTWSITGDATQLHQVLLNLCVNARDAMPRGGVLTLKVENKRIDEMFAKTNPDAKVGAYVLFQVIDTGEGISPEIIEKIFDPFFTTKEPSKGTGLGLSTVLGIIRSHGGFVTVYSEIGRGSTFNVYFPAAASNGAEPAQLIEPSLPRGNGELILVVDDEISIREITRTILERNGYEVLVAADGSEAVVLFAQNLGKIRLVLTDIAMPFLGGLELARALTKMDPRIKIIASSGLGQNSTLEQLHGLDVRVFLTKPYTAEKLLTAVHTLLQEKR